MRKDYTFFSSVRETFIRRPGLIEVILNMIYNNNVINLVIDKNIIRIPPYIWKLRNTFLNNPVDKKEMTNRN